MRVKLDENLPAGLERIGRIFRSAVVESWARCFVVATERKVRVRRPRSS